MLVAHCSGKRASEAIRPWDFQFFDSEMVKSLCESIFFRSHPMTTERTQVHLVRLSGRQYH